MNFPGKQALKDFLGEIPMTAELYWLIRQRGKPLSRFSLRQLDAALPEMVRQVTPLARQAQVSPPTQPVKRVLIFATLHYWIEHATILGLALAGQGHKVAVAILPYSEWFKPISRFDARRQNAYALRVLKQAEPLIHVTSFLETRPNGRTLPQELKNEVDRVTGYDTQYTLQAEEVDPSSDIYKLRSSRNLEVANSALAWMQTRRPDVVIVPNGTIQEMGVVFRVSKYLKIPTVTYEFGDQKERIWLAQEREVMRQETDDLWKAKREIPLTDEQLERLKAMFAARQRGALWENFSRLWQGSPARGGQETRAALRLDNRPVVLLATNVLGDSLTLGRQVFSPTMQDWIARSVQYFAGCPDVQLVLRVHPGEVLTHGPSMVDVVRQVLPQLPENIHLIGPREQVNTYDLVEVADLGLVYTTTVGLEMAMSGLPVIVAGQTHYRGRGFTIDPDSWVTYFKQLGQILPKPASFRLTRQQVELAWRYAYRFFFDYPRPFPWHLVRLWEDIQIHPIDQVLSPEGMQIYGQTFRNLVGDPLDWTTLEAIENGEVHA